MLSYFKFSKENIAIYFNALILLVLMLLNWIAPIAVLFGYFLETIVIGLIHILKLAMVNNYGKPSSKKNQDLSGFGLILFFVVHYGMFVAIQSIFVFEFFSMVIPEIESGFNLLDNFSYLISRDDIKWVLVSMIFTNIAYFYTNFLRTEKYREYSIDQLFFKPYFRIVLQQFVVVFAGFFFIILKAHLAAAILLIVFRLITDLIMVSIKKDNGFIKILSRKLAKSPAEIEKVKEQLQQFSE